MPTRTLTGLPTGTPTGTPTRTSTRTLNDALVAKSLASDITEIGEKLLGLLNCEVTNKELRERVIGRMDTKLQYHHMQMPQVCMNQAKILMRKEAVVLGILLLKESLLPVAILRSQKSPSQCLHQGFQKKKAVIRFPKRQ